MFRKMMAVLLVAVSVLSFGACGSGTATVQNTAQPTQTTAATAETSNQTTAPAVTEDTTPTEPAPVETTPAAPEAKVDEARLKNIQDSDTFPVKVEASGLRENHYQEFSWDGNDAMLAVVTNNLNEKITGFTLLVLTVDKNGQDVGMDTLGESMMTQQQADQFKCSSKVMFFSSNEEMTPGQSKNFANRCDMDNFENVYMIAYSYTDVNGNEIINENALEWLLNTKPVANG